MRLSHVCVAQATILYYISSNECVHPRTEFRIKYLPLGAYERLDHPSREDVRPTPKRPLWRFCKCQSVEMETEVDVSLFVVLMNSELMRAIMPLLSVPL